MPTPIAIAEGSLGEAASGGVLPILVAEGFDWFSTVISQYANSPIMLQLIANLAAYIDPTTNFNAFYDMVWNVDTAVGYGLDVWGRIVGVSRVLQVASGDYFGFSQASDAEPFDQAPFYNGQNLTSNYYRSERAYRRLILAKAAANITDGSIPSTNAILMTLFPGYGNNYVIDNQDMTMALHFGATLDPVDYAIVAQSGVIPKPTGVSLTITEG